MVTRHPHGEAHYNRYMLLPEILLKNWSVRISLNQYGIITQQPITLTMCLLLWPYFLEKQAIPLYLLGVLTFLRRFCWA